MSLLSFKKDSPVTVTPGIRQDADPAKWCEHRFGLSQERWDNLRDKSLWITGAGTGYGRSMAVALAAAGAKVFLTGRRSQKLDETLAEMGSYGISPDQCFPIAADITDMDQIRAACKTIESQSNSLYGLVHSAALPLRGSLRTENLEYWDRMMRTNLTAPWLLTREIFPHMIKGGEARVLFITSEAGWAFTSGAGPYNISKAAMNNLGASMAEEYATSNPGMDVQMNILSPGEARTEMNQGCLLSPYAVVSMTLMLLSHPAGGPNGKFFYRDGRHLPFAYATPYEKVLN